MKLFDWICIGLTVASGAGATLSATAIPLPQWLTIVCALVGGASASAAAVRASQRSSERSAARAAAPKS